MDRSESAAAGLITALGTLARGEADGLVVAKLNRLSRSVADFAGLLRLSGSRAGPSSRWTSGSTRPRSTAAWWPTS